MKGVTHEREIPRGDRPHGPAFDDAALFEQDQEHQGPRVVVEAVSLLIPRHDERGVLQDAGIVGQAVQVIEIHLRQARRALGQGPCLKRAPPTLSVVGRGPFQARHVPARH